MLPWLSTTSTTPSLLLAEVRETSLAKIVRDEMLGLILRGDLAPGQRINEPDVAARLGVSRVPVREALRELESSGLVAARKHMGVFVRVLGEKEVADLYDLRGVLDGHAGAKVAQLPERERRALGRKLSALTTDMKSHARRQDVQGYYASNLAFHWTLVEAAGNEAVSATYRGVVQQLHLARLKNLSQDTGMQASMVEHRAILEALAAGDADRCRALLLSHGKASRERREQKETRP
jgi:DNA-binding GntR family transcriptional regulator